MHASSDALENSDGFPFVGGENLGRSAGRLHPRGADEDPVDGMPLDDGLPLTDKYGLAPYRATDLASWWHTDADLGRPVEAFADMSKSRALGFLGFRDTERTFLTLFDRLREHRIIP